VFPFYKAHRKHDREASGLDWNMIFDVLNRLRDELRDNFPYKTLNVEGAEADDVIARWIALHPQDEHYIISSDTDFVQLLAENVHQYNGITDELLTTTGIFDAKGKAVIDKKTKEPKTIPNPEWLLFEKCMRGDTSDNVFSAFPGVRTKGTKNKVGLQEAFADRGARGYSWNNLMLQRWTDHNGAEHRVLDDYERNVTIVDLTAQPDDIKVKIAETIATNAVPKNISQIGVKFLKFCGKHELVRISEQATQYSECLSAAYPESEQVARILRS
jgi:5'-3' exonuclease